MTRWLYASTCAVILPMSVVLKICAIAKTPMQSRPCPFALWGINKTPTGGFHSAWRIRVWRGCLPTSVWYLSIVIWVNFSPIGSPATSKISKCTLAWSSCLPYHFSWSARAISLPKHPPAHVDVITPLPNHLGIGFRRLSHLTMLKFLRKIQCATRFAIAHRPTLADLAAEFL